MNLDTICLAGSTSRRSHLTTRSPRTSCSFSCSSPTSGSVLGRPPSPVTCTGRRRWTCREAELLIRRSWVRSPPAPPSLTCEYAGEGGQVAGPVWAVDGQGMGGPCCLRRGFVASRPRRCRRSGSCQSLGHVAPPEVGLSPWRGEWAWLRLRCPIWRDGWARLAVPAAATRGWWRGLGWRRRAAPGAR